MSDRNKILIIEDDADTQMYFKFILSKKYCIVLCKSDEECQKMLSEYEFDLIITDISIRGNKDGLQITSELKHSDKYKTIPIICLSAHVLQSDMDSAYKAGVDTFLPKPVSNGKLLKTIEEFLLQGNKSKF